MYNIYSEFHHHPHLLSLSSSLSQFSIFCVVLFALQCHLLLFCDAVELEQSISHLYRLFFILKY